MTRRADASPRCWRPCYAVTVRITILDILETNGISHTEISEKFNRVFEVLSKSFGASSKIVQHKTIAKVYREYSQKIDFGFYDKLDERRSLLRDKVIRSRLFPRHAGQEGTST
jgi:hypothetical protein